MVHANQGQWGPRELRGLRGLRWLRELRVIARVYLSIGLELCPRPSGPQGLGTLACCYGLGLKVQNSELRCEGSVGSKVGGVEKSHLMLHALDLAFQPALRVQGLGFTVSMNWSLCFTGQGLEGRV